MVDLSRWKYAQEAERGYHASISENQIPIHFSKLGLEPRDAFEQKDIIEIGCGTGGVVYSLSDHISDVGDVLGVDPVLSKFDKPPAGINDFPVVAGAGERLPASTSSFDTAVSFNVLDHVLSPKDVLTEVNRLLRPSGDFFLRVHVFHRPRPMRKLFDRIDAPHPHHFSTTTVIDHLTESGFAIEQQYQANRSLREKPVSEWSVKWVVGNVLAGFDTMYVHAKPDA